MKVALINASPKPSHSGSGNLMKALEKDFPKSADVRCFDFHKKEISEETMYELNKTDAWVIFAPLYVDALPSHLLNCLVQIQQSKPKKKINIYGVINCGFYEGEQTETAFEVLENWCTRCGFEFCGGIGIGGGGMLSEVPKLEDKKHTKIGVLIEFKSFARKIAKGSGYPVHFTSVTTPRAIYKAGAEATWRIQVRKNGNKLKDLGKQY